MFNIQSASPFTLLRVPAALDNEQMFGLKASDKYMHVNLLILYKSLSN